MAAVTEGENENGHSRERGAVGLKQRIHRRHQALTEAAERRREARDGRSVPEEQSDYFSNAFNHERAQIEELLRRCYGAERTSAFEILDQAKLRTEQLQKFLKDSSGFLKNYELQQAQDAFRKLQSSLEETREEVLPKKKFAFKARSKTSEPTPQQTPGSDEAAADDVGGTQVDGAVTVEQCGFSNMENAFLTKTAEEIQKQDVLLTHLTNCRVRLKGCPSTLHLKDIDGCEILCGPVSSSVFVDRCQNSMLALACQQLRTHNTTDTQVYLHVTSRAIIENCRGVGFAPFSWSYPTLEEDFRLSSLDRGRNNWNTVDDFNWLAVGTPSPNWSVIPEEDRKISWDL
ncbi:tubulin-specific chaperone C [Thalassophryne amazonica]|uniref:tubulin-specific chaperone C n=1 Tax=Thalassophryne amazonica TaxID=390379 RepID=UPI0014721619|nr:tubulin-specific chaperone C [Thalassophryne amazonica]